MLTTLDRYLFFRFLHVFAIFFVSCMGLYIIIDAFTHVDDFQLRSGSGVMGVFSRMGAYYLYQTSLFFDLIAPFLAVLAVMTVLALLLRHGELNPILASGIPTFRLVLPFAIGVLGVNALLAINQELIIPKIAGKLQLDHGKNKSTGERVHPCYDNQLVHFAGDKLFMSERRVESPSITLPFPAISENPTTITATSAVYHKAFGKRRAGWLLTNVSPSLDTISLTQTGQTLFHSLPDGTVFLFSDITLDQLSHLKQTYRYLTTRALVQKIQHPSVMNTSQTAEILHFHSRLVRPFVNIVGLFLVFPLVLRKESRNPILNLGLCALVLIGIYGLGEATMGMARVDLIAPAFAAWIPVVIGGSLAAWLSFSTRT